jgi:signal peptidase I
MNVMASPASRSGEGGTFIKTLAWVGPVKHEQVLIVTSGSMAPTFRPGDAVISAPVDVSALRAGQVVTFGATAKQAPTTHRIVSVESRSDGLWLQTRGDANPINDPNLIAASTVSGVIVGHIPFAGRWLAFYQSPMGKVILLIVPLMLVCVGQVRSMLPASRREVPVNPVPEPAAA